MKAPGWMHPFTEAFAGRFSGRLFRGADGIVYLEDASAGEQQRAGGKVVKRSRRGGLKPLTPDIIRQRWNLVQYPTRPTAKSPRRPHAEQILEELQKCRGSMRPGAYPVIKLKLLLWAPLLFEDGAAAPKRGYSGDGLYVAGHRPGPRRARTRHESFFRLRELLRWVKPGSGSAASLMRWLLTTMLKDRLESGLYAPPLLIEAPSGRLDDGLELGRALAWLIERKEPSPCGLADLDSVLEQQAPSVGRVFLAAGHKADASTLDDLLLTKTFAKARKRHRHLLPILVLPAGLKHTDRTLLSTVILQLADARPYHAGPVMQVHQHARAIVDGLVLGAKASKGGVPPHLDAEWVKFATSITHELTEVPVLETRWSQRKERRRRVELLWLGSQHAMNEQGPGWWAAAAIDAGLLADVTQTEGQIDLEAADRMAGILDRHTNKSGIGKEGGPWTLRRSRGRRKFWFEPEDPMHAL